MLQLNNLTIGFQTNKPLVSNVSATFNSGKIILLIGSNGSGKSALLKSIAGLIPSLNGEVLINNQNTNLANPEHRASLVSIMLATPPNIQNFTIEEVVHTGLQRFLRPFQKINPIHLQKINDALETTGLTEMRFESFGKLSDGQKQKTMLARCLAQDSKVILLDEPLAFLDFPSRIAFLQTLKNTAKTQDKIILFSSHDLQISADYADETVGIKNNQFFHYQPQDFNQINQFFNP